MASIHTAATFTFRQDLKSISGSASLIPLSLSLEIGTYFAFTRLCKTVSYIWGHLTKTTAKSGRRPKCKKLKVSQLTELPRNSPPIPSCYPTYPSPSSNIGHSSTPLSTLLTLLPILPNCPARYVPPYCKFTSGSPEARKEIESHFGCDRSLLEKRYISYQFTIDKTQMCKHFLHFTSK